MMATVQRVFTPGTGATPPALTGREREQAVLTQCLADPADRLAAREAVQRLGYIWSPPGQLPPVVWVAGIPSLMTYVLDRTR